MVISGLANFKPLHVYIHNEDSTFSVFVFTDASIGKGIVGKVVLSSTM